MRNRQKNQSKQEQGCDHDETIDQPGESAARERQLRVLFAFDPRRTAILLIGGDKTGDSGWDDRYVPIADDLLDKHLRELEESRGKEL